MCQLLLLDRVKAYGGQCSVRVDACFVKPFRELVTKQKLLLKITFSAVSLVAKPRKIVDTLTLPHITLPQTMAAVYVTPPTFSMCYYYGVSMITYHTSLNLFLLT